MKTKVGHRNEVAARYVKGAQHLLDIGCGPGEIISYLEGKVSKIYGVDNNKASLLIARKRGIETVVHDLDKDKLPFKSNVFDAVTCLDVIEHVKNPIFLTNEAFRVLRTNGIFVISAPNIRFTNYIFKILFYGMFPKTSNDCNGYDGGHIHYFTFSDLKSILKESGFKITCEIGIINKNNRGLMGQLLESFLGKKVMREFRSPGILIVSQKIK